jgi:hypothetical protein
MAWWWAATGALVFGLIVNDALDLRAQIATQDARLALANQRLARVAPERGRSPSPGAARAELDAMRAAQRVAARLDHPWGQILASIEAETPPGLHWLMFEHDSERPELRLEGLAPDAATALQLVDMLAARPGWSEVALSRLQAPDAREAVTAGPGWRFEIRASIDAQRIAAGRFEPER